MKGDGTPPGARGLHAPDPRDPDPHLRRRARLAELEREGADLDRAAHRLGVLRFVVFTLALIPWVVAELSESVPDGVGLFALPLLALFFVLVARHRRLRARRRRVSVAEEVARHSLARMEREWDALPAPPPPPEGGGPGHPWALDLDLHGRASLRALLGRVRTPMGAATLDGWLLSPTEGAAVIAERQEAVLELAGDDALREALAVEGGLLDPVDPEAVARFREWALTPPVIPPLAARLAWLLPSATLLLGVGDLVGLVAGWWWLLPLALSAGVAFRWGYPVHGHFALASSGVPGVRRYHALLALWEAAPAEAPLRRRLVAAFEGDEAASAALRRLDRLLHRSDARFSSLHPLLAVGVLWDLHVARALDRWRAAHGGRVAGWLESLGVLEALGSVATLAAEHPAWRFPTVVEGAAHPPRLEAEALGHPLLPPDVVVRNDVEVGPPGSVLLVTGSNMSGKSTLLRSLGLAVVMAGVGAPVCAERLTVTRCRLHTSMRVQDSLEAGVSFFMAELRRLAAILDAAPPPDSAEPPVLYLVDEILQGTNSEERRVAGRRFVRHLLRRKAIGAVTTHDLGFHEHPELLAAAHLVHFRESVGGEGEAAGLAFDYTLRPGLATTRNALRLAERVGLTEPEG